MKAKKLLSAILAVVMIIGMVPATVFAADTTAENWIDSADTTWYNTTDTEFTIDTAAELAGLASIVNAGTDTFAGKKVTLAADIDLNGKEWTPIGGYDGTYYFGGEFNGANYTVSNMTISKINASTEKLRLGLFSYIQGNTSSRILEQGYVHHLTIKNATITTDGVSDIRAGALTANLWTNATVCDVLVDGFTYTNDANCTATAYIGGIAGYVSGVNTYEDGRELANNTVKNVNITSNGFANIGGAYGYLVGWMELWDTDIDGVTINVTSENTTTGEYAVCVGGFFGMDAYHRGFDYKNCTTKNVQITLNGDGMFAAGGFGGEALGGSVWTTDKSIDSCSAQGTITNNGSNQDSDMGGYYGVTGYGGRTFENTSTNVVISSSVGTAGGFVGTLVAPVSANTTQSFKSCSVTGTVSGREAAGFIGHINDTTYQSAITIYKTSTPATSVTGAVVNSVANLSPAYYIDGESDTEKYVIAAVETNVSSTVTEAGIGDTIKVTVNVDGDGAFNASDFKLSYSNNLTFDETNSTLNGATVSYKNNVLTILDHGETQNYGDAVYTLAFTANAGGTATVSVTSAGLGNIVSAETGNLANIVCSTEAVTIEIGLPVDLADIYAGATSVKNGESYTFTAETTTGAYYTYELPKATIDGESASVIANADDSWTVENVTGALVITGDRNANTYNVTINGDTSANDGETATYGADYTFTLADDLAAGTAAGYTYTVESVTVGGAAYSSYTVAERVYTIAGADITGNVVITITKNATNPNQFNVTVTGDGAGAATLSATVVDMNGSVTLTITPEAGYSYTVSAGEYPVAQNGNEYTVSGITTAVAFTVTRSIIVDNATASEYVTLDGTTMWLVKVKTDKLDGKVYTYNGQPMLWSEKDGAYVTLVISAGTAPSTDSSNFAIVAGTATELTSSMDVNMTGTVDANDAQLVWNIYNAKYSNFSSSVTVEKFLRADVNGDGKVTVEDATAIVNFLLG